MEDWAELAEVEPMSTSNTPVERTTSGNGNGTAWSASERIVTDGAIDSSHVSYLLNIWFLSVYFQLTCFPVLGFDRRRSRSRDRERRRRSRSKDRGRRRHSRERDYDDRWDKERERSREKDRDRDRERDRDRSDRDRDREKKRRRSRSRSRDRERDRSEKKRDKRDKDRDRERKERKPEFRDGEIKIKEEPLDGKCFRKACQNDLESRN